MLLPAAISVHGVQTPHGLTVGPFSQLSAFGQDARRRGLPRAARADENVSVRQPVVLDRIAQGPRDVILPDDIVERLGAILAGENRVAHADTCGRKPCSSREICARKSPESKSQHPHPMVDSSTAARRIAWRILNPSVKSPPYLSSSSAPPSFAAEEVRGRMYHEFACRFFVVASPSSIGLRRVALRSGRF
jgi:hypothetical protein